MKLDDYSRFNGEYLLRDINELVRRKKQLETELDTLTYVSAINTDSIGGKSHNISDTVGNSALKIAEICDEISSIDECISAFEYGLSKLDDIEREIVQGFFEPNIPIHIFVERIGRKYGFSTRGVYRKRLETIEKFTDSIKEKYCL